METWFQQQKYLKSAWKFDMRMEWSVSIKCQLGN